LALAVHQAQMVATVILFLAQLLKAVAESLPTTLQFLEEVIQVTGVAMADEVAIQTHQLAQAVAVVRVDMLVLVAMGL
jgi:hypothetical protein